MLLYNILTDDTPKFGSPTVITQVIARSEKEALLRYLGSHGIHLAEWQITSKKIQYYDIKIYASSVK